MTNYEILDKKRITQQFESNDAYTVEYVSHIGYGASGSYCDKTKIGKINSYRDQAKRLEQLGYTNLKFCNGGDDDWLVVDHTRKEFAFFEDNKPLDEMLYKCTSLEDFRR